MYKFLSIGLFILIFSSCQSDKKKEESRHINYFDIQTYFKEKASELAKKNAAINKQITVNKLTEWQKLKIANWEDELSLFIKSDINKIAWKNSYLKDSTALKVIYTAKDEQLKTKYPQIDWKSMAGMRDKLIHDYFGIDYDIVLDAIANDIPELHHEIKRLLSIENNL